VRSPIRYVPIRRNSAVVERRGGKACSVAEQSSASWLRCRNRRRSRDGFSRIEPAGALKFRAQRCGPPIPCTAGLRGSPFRKPSIHCARCEIGELIQSTRKHEAVQPYTHSTAAARDGVSDHAVAHRTSAIRPPISQTGACGSFRVVPPTVADTPSRTERDSLF